MCLIVIFRILVKFLLWTLQVIKNGTQHGYEKHGDFGNQKGGALGEFKN